MPQTSSALIFISYRRAGGTVYAYQLESKLAAHFGNDKVFIDRGSIEIGEDFERKISDALSKCEVLLAVIGRTWLGDSEIERSPRWTPFKRKKAPRRIDNPGDYVRREVAAALERNIRVIPILVDGASMPKGEDLPENLKSLSNCNGLPLSDLYWEAGIAQLIPELQMIVDEAPEARLRRQREEEERRREEESKRKATADDERSRMNAEQQKQKLKAQELKHDGMSLVVNIARLIVLLLIFNVLAQPVTDFVKQLSNWRTGATAKPATIPFGSLKPTATPLWIPKATPTPAWTPQTADKFEGLAPGSDLKPKPSPQLLSTPLPFENDFGMSFVWVVRGDSGFYLSGVTNTEWKKVTGKYLNSISEALPNIFVWNVAERDARRFINKLNQMDRRYEYRLATEAERGSLPFGVVAYRRPNRRLLLN